jgi:hypothetical protein
MGAASGSGTSAGAAAVDDDDVAAKLFSAFADSIATLQSPRDTLPCSLRRVRGNPLTGTGAKEGNSPKDVSAR